MHAQHAERTAAEARAHCTHLEYNHKYLLRHFSFAKRGSLPEGGPSNAAPSRQPHALGHYIVAAGTQLLPTGQLEGQSSRRSPAAGPG